MHANQDQQDYWTSPAGLKWIEHEDALDTAMAGLLDVMLNAANISASDRVVDIGCGTGASTIGAAQRAADGRVLGVDFSKPLLDRATTRARNEGVGNASFLLADAQTHLFERDEADILVSRIGMSFFSDPVSALGNLASAMRRGGQMTFVCWASVGQNPWFLIPKRAAEARLGTREAGDPRAPGPTAFEDIAYVTGLMAKAGLMDVSGEAVEVPLTPPDGPRGAAKAASRVGPAARIVKAFGGSKQDAEAIEDDVAKAFEQFLQGNEMDVPAVFNLFTCRI
jgi:SAM-dependent methyltransferase